MSVSMRLGRRLATRRSYPVALGAEHWLTRVLPLDRPREGGGLFGRCARADCITDEGSSQTRSGRSVHDLSLDEIRAARERIGGVGTDSPLVRLNVDDAPAEIYLKLENLQPIGSFKLRGARNLLQLADRRDLRKGVWTAGAGNMAQGVAWFDTLGRSCYTVGCCPRGSRPVRPTTDSQCPQLVQASLRHGRAEGAGRHPSGAPMNPKIRSDFPVTRDLTCLDTAYDGPYPPPVLEAACEFLHEKGVVALVNLGRELRISPHFFNTEEEIDHLLSVLQAGL